MCPNTKRTAFTLIELLVVIAVIATLIAVLIPSLNAAKKYATSAACLSNEKSLARAWMMYIEQNDGLIPGGAITEGRMFDGMKQGDASQQKYPVLWVWPPVTTTLQYFGNSGDMATLEDRIRGCERGGLWPYIENHKTYHCPADKAYVKAMPENRYRSYSMARGLAVYDVDQDITKLSEIKSPGHRYVFVEEAYDLRVANYNHNAWDFEVGENDFHDPLALFHNDSSTFGLADGHAEKYKWKDQRTVDYFADRDGAETKYGGQAGLAANNTDLTWLQMHFVQSETRIQQGY
jgi:prepilin-type N-terminal cleavage/methylation domain-containing protein